MILVSTVRQKSFGLDFRDVNWNVSSMVCLKNKFLCEIFNVLKPTMFYRVKIIKLVSVTPVKFHRHTH